MLTASDLRHKYIEFFKSKGHVEIPSASLIPENDPTTLFTGSGMQPMIPYLLGEKHPLGTRICDSQKCFRAQDIEDVGDNRHTVFFEMLGNWSLGDYFKAEQIAWMFEFLTKELGLNPEKIYISVFHGHEKFNIPRDDEAVKIWQAEFKKAGIEAPAMDNAEKLGVQDGRIFYYDAKKNWWSRSGVPEKMPIGEPGGPDSEMFWDFGAGLKLHENSIYKDQPCHVNCDCGRFMEIGNNVFMQYLRTADGVKPLKKKNIDFGGGLERIMTALNNDPDIFKIDIFKPVIQELEKLSGKKYGESDELTYAFRVIADHLRAATFLVGDGALPSNKDHGYFTRRLIRRAARMGDKLGVEGLFTEKIVKKFIDDYAAVYPALGLNQAEIISHIGEEEKKFNKTLANGLKEFNRVVKELGENQEISGEDGFLLFSSYGFPCELTEELAKERGLTVNKVCFSEEFKKHQDISRLGADKKFKGGLSDHSEQNIKYHTATHLLNAALRKILGNHVYQKGSNITPERLRFDFSHSDKMTDGQKLAVEKLINEQIKLGLPVICEEMSVEKAKNQGAIGVFDAKYGDKVKVYTICEPNGEYFSQEICGGPHVANTSELGQFKIQKEEASSAGVRRIKAVLK